MPLGASLCCAQGKEALWVRVSETGREGEFGIREIDFGTMQLTTEMTALF